MRITESVIQDLLPVYLAGSECRHLSVDRWLLGRASDLARQVAAARRWSLRRRTRQRSRTAWKGSGGPWDAPTFVATMIGASGFAIAFSMPLSFGSYDERGLHFIFWPDYVGAAVVSLLLGLICWPLHLDRQLRPRGF
ncbi:MAG: hypothetical protein R3E12_09710 [Candidatus Eisenbacteria bacterium]